MFLCCPSSRWGATPGLALPWACTGSRRRIRREHPLFLGVAELIGDCARTRGHNGVFGFNSVLALKRGGFCVPWWEEGQFFSCGWRSRPPALGRLGQTEEEEGPMRLASGLP